MDVILISPVFMLGGSAVLTGLGAVLVYRHLERREEIVQCQMCLGVLLLFLACLYVGWITSIDEFYGIVIAVIQLPVLLGTAVIAGIWIGRSPKWQRRVAGLLLGLVFPVLWVASAWGGMQFSPQFVTERNGVLIAEALQVYYADKGTYPATLDALAPDYLAELPEEPPFVWGWLYKATGDSFSLGYVSYLARGYNPNPYSVCLITSDSMEWDCISSSGPFKLGPTPMPTLFPSRSP